MLDGASMNCIAVSQKIFYGQRVQGVVVPHLLLITAEQVTEVKGYSLLVSQIKTSPNWGISAIKQNYLTITM